MPAAGEYKQRDFETFVIDSDVKEVTNNYRDLASFRPTVGKRMTLK